MVETVELDFDCLDILPGMADPLRDALTRGDAIMSAEAPAQNNPLLTPEELAARLRSKPRTLERWRTDGSGPSYIKIGRRVAYRLDDVEKWLAQQRRAHTLASAPPAA